MLSVSPTRVAPWELRPSAARQIYRSVEVVRRRPAIGVSSVTDRLITPSKITAWLDCAHFLTLRNRVDDGLLTEPDPTFGSFARLLAAKGASARACLPGGVCPAGQVDPGDSRQRARRTFRGVGRPCGQPVRRGLGRHLPDAVRP